MDDADMQEQPRTGLVQTLNDNRVQIGVTAAIGIIGFATTMMVLMNPGAPTMVPALMAGSTALFTLVAADVVKRPMRTIVVLAGLMLFGYLSAMSLALPMSKMILGDRTRVMMSIPVPPPSASAADAPGAAVGAGAR